MNDSPIPQSKPPRRERTLAILLTLTFFTAMIMGAGPGIYLINGKGPILGLPAVYAWVLFWFLIQAITVIIAFQTVWKKESSG